MIRQESLDKQTLANLRKTKFNNNTLRIIINLIYSFFKSKLYATLTNNDIVDSQTNLWTFARKKQKQKNAFSKAMPEPNKSMRTLPASSALGSRLQAPATHD